MKIKRIHIYNYGKWHNVTIPLNQGLNILYGRNEAGKTTLISFIKGVLFGYLQGRSSHKNYIPRNSKNYGGQLEIVSDNKSYIIQRMAGKKGGKVTVLDPKGHQMDGSILPKLLGPFDRDTYNALYYFGTVDLQAMGKLKQKDLIYRIQRIGLADSDKWIDYREALEKQAKKLYSPRGYKPPLNQALKKYDQLVDQARVAKSGYQDYQALLNQIHKLNRQQNTLSSKIKNVSYRANQLKQDQDTWLRYQRMMKLRPVMAKPFRRGFSQQDLDRLRGLKTRLTDLNNQIKLARQRIREFDRQKVTDSSVTDYQRHQDKINRLADQFNDLQQQIHQLSLLNDRFTDLRRQASSLRKRYTVNQHTLLPLTEPDLRKVKALKTKAQTTQNQIPVLSHKLLTFQSRKPLGIKEYVTGGLSLLFMIAGLIIKLWLLAGLGAVILILATVYYFMRNDYHQQIQQIHVQIKQVKTDDERIHQQLRTIQAKYHYPSNVDEWLANQNNLRELRTLKGNVRKLHLKIESLNQTIRSYFGAWAFINRQITLSSDDANRLLQLKNYVNKMDRINRVNQQADKQSWKAAKALSDLTAKQAKEQKALTEFYQSRHVRDADEFTKVQQQQRQISQEQQTYQQLSKQIGQIEIQVLKRYRTLEDLKATANEVNHQLMDLKGRSQKVTGQLTAAQIKLRQMTHNGSYDQLQQRIANYQTQIIELAKEWLQQSLASQWIDATLNLATRGRVPKIERQAQRNFQILTGQRYVSIIFNKSKIKVMRKDKKRFTLYEISKGTVQQLYLALIFAMAQVFNSDYPMPVIIDDGFTDFDVIRKRAAVKLLKGISSKLQVIYCTSDSLLADQPETLNLNQIK